MWNVATFIEELSRSRYVAAARKKLKTNKGARVQKQNFFFISSPLSFHLLPHLHPDRKNANAVSHYVNSRNRKNYML